MKASPKRRPKRISKRNPDPSTSSLGGLQKSYTKKYSESEIPKFRKIYIYEYKLPETFGRLINEFNEENLTLIIFVSTFLNSNKEEIRQSYSYLIEIINRSDTVLKKIITPENTRYSSNDEATTAAVIALRNNTKFFVSPHALKLLKYDIVQLRDVKTKFLENEDEARKLLFINGFNKKDINELIEQAKKINDLFIKNKRDDAAFQLELLREKYGKIAPAVVGLLSSYYRPAQPAQY